MLRIVGLSKRYEEYSEEPVQALEKINLSFGKNGLIVLRGASGCGKTTLLNLIGRLDVPTEGSIEFRGEKLEKLSEEELERYWARDTAFVYQNYQLLDELSVMENIKIPLYAIGMNEEEAEAEAERAATLVGIAAFKGKNVKKLSGGQQQRVAVARAIAKHPKMILCDEPTGNLDGKNSEIIFRLLKEIAADCLVIVVTHDEVLAEQYADRLIFLRYGKVEADSGKEESENLPTEENKRQAGETRRIPYRTCFDIAKGLMRKRAARVMISVFMLFISFYFGMLMFAMLTHNRGKSIEKYLEGRYAGLDTYYEVDGSAGAVRGRVTSGLALFQKLRKFSEEGCVYRKHYYACTLDGTEAEESWLVAVQSESCPAGLTIAGSWISSSKEIVLGNKLAGIAGITAEMLPCSVKVNGNEYTLTGILENGKKPLPDGFGNAIFCTEACWKELIAKNTSYIPGLDFITAYGIKEMAEKELKPGDASELNAEILTGRNAEAENEAVVSREFLESRGYSTETVLGRTFSCLNIRMDSLYDGYLNLYEYCGETITIVGIADGDRDVWFYGPVYESILSASVDYDSTTYGLLFQDKMNFEKLDREGLLFDEKILEAVYDYWHSERSQLKYLAAIGGLMLFLAVLQMISLFTFSVSDSGRKIGILRSFGFPFGQLTLIFAIEGLFITLAAAALSLLGLIATVFLYNRSLIRSLFGGTAFYTLSVRPPAVLLVLILFILLFLVTMVYPIGKMKKKTVTELLQTVH